MNETWILEWFLPQRIYWLGRLDHTTTPSTGGALFRPPPIEKQGILKEMETVDAVPSSWRLGLACKP